MTQAQQREIWLFNIKFRENRERYWTPKIYKELIAMIKEAMNKPSIEIAIQQVDISVRGEGIAKVIEKIYIDAGKVMGGHTYQYIKRGFKQKQLMPMGQNEQMIADIIAYLNEYILDKAVLPITDTMREWIKRKAIEGQQKGWSLQMVADELIRHDFPKNRAYVITRTEVLRAANYGAVAGAKQTGLELRKEWISGISERTRRIPRDEFDHIRMNGVVVGFNEPFRVPRRDGTFEELNQPGDPVGSAANVIQCRCTVGFIPVE